MAPVAVIDLDDTLIDLAPRMQMIVDQCVGVCKPWENWHVYDLSNIYNVNYSDIIKCWIDGNMLEDVEPYNGAQSFLEHVSSRGYYIAINTARAWHPAAREITIEWLARYNFTYDELIIHDSEKLGTKINSVNHLENLSIAIDDNTSHLNGFIQSKKFKTVLIKDMPWNRSMSIPKDAGIRVKSFEDCKKYL